MVSVMLGSFVRQMGHSIFHSPMLYPCTPKWVEDIFFVTIVMYVAQSGKRYPNKYFKGLTRRNQLVREKELVRRRSRLQYTNSKVKTKRSGWTVQFHTHYPNLKFNKQLLSKRFKIPVKILDIVFDRGMRAWQTSGSRPGANPYQWATARVYKFILIHNGKATTKKYDPNQNMHRLVR